MFLLQLVHFVHHVLLLVPTLSASKNFDLQQDQVVWKTNLKERF